MAPTILDPRGDVVLITTSDMGGKVEFLVQSKVLALASEVFASLFGPRFREGTALENSSSSHPAKVPLPDDSPHGMRILLSTIHHREEPPELDLEDLADLALVVDKYACQHIFRVRSTIWMEALFLGNRYLVRELPKYLGIAYAFKNPLMFAHIALGLALTTGLPWNKSTLAERLCGMPLADLVPEKICQKIDSYRDVLNRRVTVGLMDLIRPLTSKRVGHGAGLHDDALLCRHDEAVIATYFRILHNCQLLPPTDAVVPVLRTCLRLISVAKAIKKADSMQLNGLEPWTCGACDFAKHIQDDLLQTFASVARPEDLSVMGALVTCDRPEYAARLSENFDIQNTFNATMQLLFGDELADCLLSDSPMSGDRSLERKLVTGLSMQGFTAYDK